MRNPASTWPWLLGWLMDALVVVGLIPATMGLFAAEVVQDDEVAHSAVRFAAVELFIDSGDVPLAAWQVELEARRGNIRIVGIENGAHPAFSERPPYYDPGAMMNDRVVIAHYSLARAERLPTGRTRIATVHIQMEGEEQPEFALALNAAGNQNGHRIDQAEATLHMRSDQ